jgi:3-isopropylmalate/(R)-2-methylmalate dehydratase large subunit
VSLPRTLIDKIWDAHLVADPTDAPAILYIDLHLVHEVTSPQAFDGLRARGLAVRRPDRTLAMADHSVPTAGGLAARFDEGAAKQVSQLLSNCAAFGVTCYGPGHDRQGIVHVSGPELGLTQPGMTVVCGDSHTATHGAFGALAFGIGTSEVEMVLATQCLLQRRPRTCRVRVDGVLGPGVGAKDVILAIIATVGVDGGTGYAFEYCGSTVAALTMDQRMTICNMSIEAGARAGLVAPDDTTFQYLETRPLAPKGSAWEAKVARWRRLPGDSQALYDREVTIDAARLEPMITFGTNPGMAIPITSPVPEPSWVTDRATRESLTKALAYMKVESGRTLIGHPIDVVFVGSCTNGRLSDLREAASILRGRKVHPGVRMLVVPGSREVKRQAEAEGLDRVFLEAGAEWRDPGCSMCIAMNGDRLDPGQTAVATSNRNFEGRQGPGGRTILASPLTAAAAAVTGRIADARRLA